MDGRDFANWVETELHKKGIPKGEFYSKVGITAASLWGWKNGSVPKKETLLAVQEFLGKPYQDPTIGMPSDTAELLESIRNRPDLGVLLRSAKDMPPSSVYTLVAQLELEKERNAE